MAERRKFTVEKRSYSRAPWRIIDSETGLEVDGPTVVVDTWNGPQPVAQCGWDTKAEAVDWLGVLAAKAWTALAEDVNR